MPTTSGFQKQSCFLKFQGLLQSLIGKTRFSACSWFTAGEGWGAGRGEGGRKSNALMLLISMCFSVYLQVIKWKKEWTVPQRLLQKRLLSFGKHLDEYCQQHDESNSDCQYEWLVKWTGLGYEHATWELEDASFLTSLEAIKLIRDYESRHEKTERMSSLSQADEVLVVYMEKLLV